MAEITKQPHELVGGLVGVTNKLKIKICFVQYLPYYFEAYNELAVPIPTSLRLVSTGREVGALAALCSI